MDQTTHPRRSGSYTANLLGNIRSHLAGLQGYDVMALELIQNADDAKAEEIIFDITDRGLLVRNSGRFTYCGDLHTRPCGFWPATATAATTTASQMWAAVASCPKGRTSAASGSVS